ncbi:hypothetical protein [Flavobacterium wongokense]|uniref:hypothetical protein n=1 Tax=Flavobacterium wongokense TaxID=2910674 RepID=UPI001F295566|nr:hypothetical protein [Flavobacterium sp. WG47]MCF6133370.1 hypothetical protein [Flavobacterium sp. WG47]
MFNQYSYKLKFKFLIVFFIILSVAAYKRSFSNLILLYKENSTLREKKGVMKNQAPNVNALTVQVAGLDKLIGKEGVEKEKIQQEIIAFLVKNSSGVSINDLQPIHNFTYDDYQVYTYQIDLTGSYNELLDITYKFERQFEYSKIISLAFYTDKKNSKTEILHLKLIFQNYESNK